MAEPEIVQQDYRSFFENALEGMFRADPAGRLSLANPALARMLGYPDAEVMLASEGPAGGLWVDVGRRAEMFQAVEQRGSVEGFECEWRRDDGASVWVALSVRAVRDTSGASLMLEGVATDVTQRRRAETELRASEHALRELVAGTSALVGEAFFDRLVQHVAAAFRVRFAFVAELQPGGERLRTLAAWNGTGLVDTIEYDLAGTPCADALDTGVCFHPDEVQQRFPAGGLLAGMESRSYCGVALRSGNGERLGVLAVLDVEPMAIPGARMQGLLQAFAARAEAELERLRAERERRHLEQQQHDLQRRIKNVAREWQQTFDTIDAPTLILDPAGHVMRLNRAAVTCAGLTYAEVLGDDLAVLGPFEPWLGAARLLEQVRRTGTAGTAQVYDPHRGQSWSLFAAPPVFDEAEREQRVILMARDVSETVKLQESLRRTERMSAIGALVAGVAHEVRNPLFAITANLDALEAELAAGKPHEESLAVVNDAVDRLTRLMADLLDYGNAAPLRLVTDSLAEVLEEAARASRPRAAEKRVFIELEVDEALPRVAMDRQRLRRGLENLLHNAVLQATAGGRVRLSARASADRCFVECHVDDDGPGIDLVHLPRMFEPFFARHRGGTGLGLSIVQKIAEDHGGSVSATNGPEGGGRLTVRLPAATADASKETLYQEAPAR
jgi:PAS domain S-box-containing protein